MRTCFLVSLVGEKNGPLLRRSCRSGQDAGMEPFMLIARLGLLTNVADLLV